MSEKLCTDGRVSVQAKPEVQTAIETADSGANAASAAQAATGSGIAAISSSTTAPVPASPCSAPIASASRGVRRRSLVVGVRAVATPPAQQDARREGGDHEADQRLRAGPEPLGDRRAEQDQRQADDEQGRRVADPPHRAEPGRRARAGAVGGDERGDRHQVIGVGRVAQPEQRGEQQGDRQRGAVEQGADGLVEVLDRGEEEVEAHRDPLSVAQSGHSPTIGKWASAGAYPQAARTASPMPASAASSSTAWRPQRSQAA